MIKFVAFDFDGVFTDNHVWTFEDGHEAVRCSRADGLGLDMLRDAGVHMLVISTEPNPVVAARCRKLNIACRQGVADKLETLKFAIEPLGITLEECAFVGNDINDLEVLRAVGYPVIVADAEPDLIAALRPAPFRWLSRAGGEGAVREFCSGLVRARVLLGTG